MKLLIQAIFLVCCIAVSALNADAQSRINDKKESPSIGHYAVKPKSVVDTTKCRLGGSKYVYWAAGRYVFRFLLDPTNPVSLPSDRQSVGSWVDANKEIPSPNNPQEPEGCRENPLRAGAVPYMQAVEGKKFREIYGRDIDYRTAVWTGFSAAAIREKDRTLNEQIKKWRKSDKRVCAPRSSEMSECKYFASKNESDFERAHFFQINSQGLLEGVGIDEVNFSVQKDPASYANKSNGYVAESDFLLFDSIRIRSGFRIHQDEIDRMPEIHRELIRYLLDARVKDYRWKN